MALYLKRLVSGRKTRFRDDHLNLELDLAYVTDRIIVMGFPAVGMESIYRNNRADVHRFLTARHGSDFWVFNFCPVRENAYPEDVFQGRVSRYPFPDHHVPPFVYLSLVTREIQAWLSGSDARVAVLHCKAGKGRSGVLACAYLLLRQFPPFIPVPNALHESAGEWSLIGDDDPQTPLSTLSPIDPPPLLPASAPPGAGLPRVSSEPVKSTLDKVLELHTSRRMKFAPVVSRHHSDAPLASKHKMGVSIPSQQRWLFYWSQVLDGNGPSSLRPFPYSDYPQNLPGEAPRVSIRLDTLTVRMREPSGIQPRLAHAASTVIGNTGKARTTSESTSGRLWACLARYSDQLAGELGCCEIASRRSAGTMKSGPFVDDKWDKDKMIRSFAQIATSDVQPTVAPVGEGGRSVTTYILCPLVEEDWVKLRAPTPEPDNETSHSTSITGNVSQEGELTESLGILLDPNRELRIKLFVGEVSLGWVWLIPSFHISPDSPSSTCVFSRGDIDFASGMGKTLVDLRVLFTTMRE